MTQVLESVLKRNSKTLIDGLPFITELYERAEPIFKSKYGKDGEVSSDYKLQSLITLSKMHYSNPQKANQSYEKLVTYLQAISTTGNIQ